MQYVKRIRAYKAIINCNYFKIIMQLSIAISKKMCYYNNVERQENKKGGCNQPKRATATNQKKKGSPIITRGKGKKQ